MFLPSMEKLPHEALGDILDGTDMRLDIRNETMSTSHYSGSYDGLVKYIEMQQDEDAGADATSSTADTNPSPLQRLHAPCGELKEKL